MDDALALVLREAYGARGGDRRVLDLEEFDWAALLHPRDRSGRFTFKHGGVQFDGEEFNPRARSVADDARTAAKMLEREQAAQMVAKGPGRKVLPDAVAAERGTLIPTDRPDWLAAFDAEHAKWILDRAAAKERRDRERELERLRKRRPLPAGSVARGWGMTHGGALGSVLRDAALA